MVFILLRGLVWIFIAWRWGDWRHWQRYQATILFTIMCDLLYNVLTYNHTLWEYVPGFYLNHVTANLVMQFLLYPPAILVYLSRFPEKFGNQILWVIFWIGLMEGVELAEIWMGIIHYEHGWNIWWSMLFDVFMFGIIRFHFKKPLWAYFSSAVTVITLMLVFHVSVSSMK